MERGEAHHCLPAASRFCNGTEPVQPEDSRAFDRERGRMPTEIFQGRSPAHLQDRRIEKLGETERIRCGQERRISVFPGQGSRGMQCPLSGVPGVKLPARVKGGKPLSGCRGAARPVDERLARTEAERRPTCPAPGRGRKAPPSWVAVYGSPYWVLPAENVSQKPRVHEAGAFEKTPEPQKRKSWFQEKCRKLSETENRKLAKNEIRK